MKLTRNKEIKRMLCLMLLISLSAVIIAFSFSPSAAIVTGLSCFLLCDIFLLYTGKRYRQLARLSDDLKSVNDGEDPLDLPGHDEGELSILKSEIYKVTVSLREQNDQLKKEKLKLADALSDISHQFKTPLTSLFVMSDLLSEEKIDENQRYEFTLQLEAQLERLKWLTESLLKLSRLDADAVSFKPSLISHEKLIHKACSPLLIPMELKDQSLVIDTKGSVFCDLNWTAEALSNILKNNMEHTPAGGIIHIQAQENVLFSEIRVWDNGPGIDKDDLPYIFDRFYKGKNASKDSVGIGLSMSRSIVNAQGGQLEVSYAFQGGTEFILRFPTHKTRLSP